LRELAEQQGMKAYLVDGPDQIERHWLRDKSMVGVTAGASAPEVLVQRVVAHLEAWGAVSITELDGREERITFALPKTLRAATGHAK